jgi:hypothetical protein
MALRKIAFSIGCIACCIVEVGPSTTAQEVLGGEDIAGSPSFRMTAFFNPKLIEEAGVAGS